MWKSAYDPSKRLAYAVFVVLPTLDILSTFTLGCFKQCIMKGICNMFFICQEVENLELEILAAVNMPKECTRKRTVRARKK